MQRGKRENEREKERWKKVRGIQEKTAGRERERERERKREGLARFGLGSLPFHLFSTPNIFSSDQLPTQATSLDGVENVLIFPQKSMHYSIDWKIPKNHGNDDDGDQNEEQPRGNSICIACHAHARTYAHERTRTHSPEHESTN